VRFIALGPQVTKIYQPELESEVIKLTIEAPEVSFTEKSMWEKEGPLEALLKGAEEYIVVYTNCSNPTIMTISDKQKGKAETRKGQYSRDVDISLRSSLSEERNSIRLEEGEADIDVMVGSYPKWSSVQAKLEPYGSSARIFYSEVYAYVEMLPFLA
jgi:hypothetical protein